MELLLRNSMLLLLVGRRVPCVLVCLIHASLVDLTSPAPKGELITIRALYNVMKTRRGEATHGRI